MVMIQEKKQPKFEVSKNIGRWICAKCGTPIQYGALCSYGCEYDAEHGKRPIQIATYKLVKLTKSKMMLGY